MSITPKIITSSKSVKDFSRKRFLPNCYKCHALTAQAAWLRSRNLTP
jgi:hypothetical protein